MALRSNSFNLTPRLDVMRPSGAPCPLVERPEPLSDVAEPERAVWLRLRDRMRLFVTTTHDFDRAALERAKALGQIYVDKSHKQSPDDFRSDLGALAKMPDCAGCPREAGCPGAYRAAAQSPFDRDEARTRELLRELGGSILDVGAGDAPYASELAPRVLAGQARYLALDPDAERLRLLLARCPWAETRTGGLEDLPAELRFRHVVFLRSVNHLPEPERTLTSAVERLEPGGTLLLVDDVAFGLVRDAEQAERAESGSARFEHHRNDSAGEVHARVASMPLTLLERRDVRPGGSNQWLLRYEKREVGR